MGAAKSQGVVPIKTIRIYCWSVILASCLLYFGGEFLASAIESKFFATLLLEYPIPFHHCFIVVLLWNGITLWILAECSLPLQGRLKHPIAATAIVFTCASIGLLVAVKAVVQPDPD